MSVVNVIELEGLRYQALVDANLSSLDTLISDDVRYIHTNGIVDSKASLIESLASGKRKYLSIIAVEQEVRQYGDLHIITGEIKIQYIARGDTYEALLAHTSVWLERSDQAQLISWHSSPSTFGK